MSSSGWKAAVSCADPVRTRTIGTHTTLRNSRSATVRSGPPAAGSNSIERNSLRCLSARISRLAGTRRSVEASGPVFERPMRIASSSPRRISKKPRSQPVTASAASTNATSTSSVESEACSALASSSMARSLPRFAPPAISAAGACAFSRLVGDGISPSQNTMW